MSVDVLFCSAPVMSVVRPSAALGLLQALLRQKGIRAESLYLNLLFADRIGLDLNEQLAEKLPSHLLAGDWLFGDCIGTRSGRPQAQRHIRELGAAIERKGLAQLYEIRCNLIPSFVAEAADRLLERNPKIIGFTSMFEQTVASLAIAAAVRARDPSVVICFGGANCHGPMGAVLLKNFAQIDYVFNGEADTVFGPAVEAILRGERPRGMPGCLCRDEAATGAATGPTAMDALPIPDYADYFAQLADLSEAARVRPSIPFESSRGCWWGQKHHCTFCGLNGEGMAFRAKSAPRVLHEIETLHAAFGVGRFAATDNILGMNHIDGVLGKLAERPSHGFRFFYEIKANMDEAQLEKLALAGTVWLQPGIESLSDPVLHLMRKGVSALLNLRLLRNCRELGVGLVWSILYGFPGEPRDAYDAVAKMAPLLEHLQPPVGCGRIRLDRFSPNFERAAEIGFRNVTPMPAYGAIYDVPDEDLANLAYFFEGDAPDAASEQDLVALKAASATWRARWFDQPFAPQLTMTEVGAAHLVSDTRACAFQPFYCPTPVEIAVLNWLRNPSTRPNAVAQFAERFDAASIEAAMDALLMRRFAIEIDGRMLSLVTEAGREIFDAEARAEFPLGFVLPRGRVAAQDEAGALHASLTDVRGEPVGLERVEP
ncbi:RiPP maturation radical SAM C-methyltransferase [Bradyrhizobium sp. SSUT112]|uniref:RiPP maturation radical SAM C-methyltransferase n=1 Tax=Bradyrhizobium sp. SSUT112 TaxID=3040604 RepID=UPI002446CCE6|nr:RiPP maturation radical SAM C-methyltransferase [Bradyrhizobium sp. SSUT112]MDH2352380.1 RiPP maturation radical SAM C-methyltransferase [Bradyrhizobium sp. SSUT112]